MKVWTSPALMLVEEAKVGPLYGVREPVNDWRRAWKNLLWGAPRLPTRHDAPASACLAPFTGVFVLREIAFHLGRCKFTHVQTIEAQVS